MNWSNDKATWTGGHTVLHLHLFHRARGGCGHGKELWRHILKCPAIPAQGLRANQPRRFGLSGNVCRDPDGRLLRESQQRRKVWEVDTVIDRDRFYTITGAPKTAGKVFTALR